MNKVVLLGVFLVSLFVGSAQAEFGLPFQPEGSLLSEAQVIDLDFETAMRFNSRVELDLLSDTDADQLVQMVEQSLINYGWVAISTHTSNGRIITNFYKTNSPSLKMEISATSSNTYNILLYRYF